MESNNKKPCPFCLKVEGHTVNCFLGNPPTADVLKPLHEAQALKRAQKLKKYSK